MSAFNELINGSTPVLVDFFAAWCGPCKAMSPVLQDLAGRIGDRARIIKVDVDKNPAAAQAYQVRGVPTFIIFKNGKQYWRQSGMVSAEELERQLSAAG